MQADVVAVKEEAVVDVVVAVLKLLGEGGPQEDTGSEWSR